MKALGSSSIMHALWLKVKIGSQSRRRIHLINSFRAALIESQSSARMDDVFYPFRSTSFDDRSVKGVSCSIVPWSNIKEKIPSWLHNLSVELRLWSPRSLAHQNKSKAHQQFHLVWRVCFFYSKLPSFFFLEGGHYIRWFTVSASQPVLRKKWESSRRPVKRSRTFLLFLCVIPVQDEPT